MDSNGTLAVPDTTISGGDAEIIEADIVPGFGITLDEARRRLTELRVFVQEQMIEGEDYGIIPGTKKPSLWKPGAEKLNAIYGLAPVVETLDKYICYGTAEEKPFAYFEMKVKLINKRDGRVEAEGVGSCNSGEKKYKSQSALDVMNTVFKMAKKRALVDATLSATRASGIFTQDTEDMPREAFQARGDGQAQRQRQQAHPQQRQPQPAAQPQQPKQYDPLGDLLGANLDWLIECRDWIAKNVPDHPQRQEVLNEIKRQQDANRAKLEQSQPPAAQPRPRTVPIEEDDGIDPFVQE